MNSSMPSLNLPADALPTVLETLKAEKIRRSTENKLAYYKPYPKQAAFHEAGAIHRERLFMAGNRVGKTECGAAELAMHLTGQYPKWWLGRRFDKPVRAWALASRMKAPATWCKAS